MNLKLGNTEEVGPPGEGEMSRADKKALRKAQADKEAAGKEKQDSGSESDEESEGDDLLNPWKAAETRQAEKAKVKAAPAAAPPIVTRKERYGSTSWASIELMKSQRSCREEGGAGKISEASRPRYVWLGAVHIG